MPKERAPIFCLHTCKFKYKEGLPRHRNIYPELSSDKWAQKTAARENMASEKSIKDYEKILRDLMAEDNKEISLNLLMLCRNQWLIH